MRILVVGVAVEEDKRGVAEQVVVRVVLARLQLAADRREVHRLLNHAQVVRYLQYIYTRLTTQFIKIF